MPRLQHDAGVGIHAAQEADRRGRDQRRPFATAGFDHAALQNESFRHTCRRLHAILSRITRAIVSAYSSSRNLRSSSRLHPPQQLVIAPAGTVRRSSSNWPSAIRADHRRIAPAQRGRERVGRRRRPAPPRGWAAFRRAASRRPRSTRRRSTVAGTPRPRSAAARPVGAGGQRLQRGGDHAPDRHLALRLAAQIVQQRRLQRGQRALVHAQRARQRMLRAARPPGRRARRSARPAARPAACRR